VDPHSGVRQFQFLVQTDLLEWMFASWWNMVPEEENEVQNLVHDATSRSDDSFDHQLEHDLSLEALHCALPSPFLDHAGDYL